MRYIAGKTGSGKTNLVTRWFLDDRHEQRRLRLIGGPKKWLTAVYPHRQTGLAFIGELLAAFGMEWLRRYVVIEDLARMDRVLMRQYVKASAKESYFDRLNENDAFGGAFIDMATRRQNLRDLAESPNKDRYTRIGIRLKQNQDCWWPDSWLPRCYYPKSDEWQFAVDHCTDPQIKSEVESWQWLPPRDLMTTLWAAARLIEGILLSPPILARTCDRPRWDKIAHHNDGKIHIILGGAISDDALRVHVGSDFMETVFLAKNQLIGPGIYCIDEVNNYLLCGELEAKALQTLRVFGMDIWFVDQSLGFPTPEITQKVLQNTDHFWFASADPTILKTAAGSLVGMLDEMKVHHYDEITRQVHLGFTEQRKVSKGISKGPNGETTSEQESSTLVPTYGDRIERKPSYQSANEQLVWLQQKLSQQPVGQCYVNQMGRAPYILKVPLLKNSWKYEELQQRMVSRCLEEMLQLDIYQTPVLRRPPRAITPSAGGGMRKSKSSSNGNGRQLQPTSSKQGSSQRRNGRAGA